MTSENWGEALEAAVRAVYGWLGSDVQFFRDHPDRCDQEMFLAHISGNIGAFTEDAEQEAIRQRQLLLLFVGRYQGKVVCAGFRQFGGRNIALHSFGVRDDAIHTGIGTAMLKWIFGALPATYLTGNARCGVFRSNQSMLSFARKFGADVATDVWKGGGAEDAEALGAVMLDIPVAKACQVLGIPEPNGDLFQLRSEPVDGITFEPLYFGRHPRRLQPEDPRPIVTSFVP